MATTATDPTHVRFGVAQALGGVAVLALEKWASVMNMISESTFYSLLLGSSIIRSKLWRCVWDSWGPSNVYYSPVGASEVLTKHFRKVHGLCESLQYLLRLWNDRDQTIESNSLLDSNLLAWQFRNQVQAQALGVSFCVVFWTHLPQSRLPKPTEHC